MSIFSRNYETHFPQLDRLSHVFILLKVYKGTEAGSTKKFYTKDVFFNILHCNILVIFSLEKFKVHENSTN